MFGVTRAPEIDRHGLVWFNTADPLSLAMLRGRIVILDFWTDSCINCLQLLPTLQRVEERFPTEVVVIGIHSPKFIAERRPEHVAEAIRRTGIRHPVAHDPSMMLWDAYAVRVWPTLVFLSPDGYVIGETAGEPTPDALLRGLDDLTRQFREEDSLRPAQLPLSTLPAGGRRLRYPGKIKPCPADRPLWAVADSGHHQVGLFDDAGTEAARYGTGLPGFVDGGPGEARFRSPQGLACDRAAIWVTDTGNHALRRIDRASGQVSTVAGLGLRGGPLRLAEPAAGAALASPWDAEVIGAAIYIANAGTHQIARYDVGDGRLHPVAGTGGEGLVDGPARQALLAQPSGLAATTDRRGLFFVDAETSSVRLLSLDGDPRVTTLVGQGLFAFGHRDGAFEQALLQHPLGLAAGDGLLYVADSYNGLVRRLDLRSRQVAALDIGDCGGCRPGGEPAGIAVAGPARLLLSDSNNHRIVEVDLAARANRSWVA